MAQTVVIAHRGASGTAPENTLSAVKRALEMGADQIEIDVHLSKDGEVIVIHDPTLERTTTGTGTVEEHTLQELKKLDAGTWFSEKFTGEPIPTLEEVLDMIDGKAVLLIEIKHGKQHLYEGISQKVIERVRKKKAASWVIIQSFETEVVEECIELAPDLEVHKLIVTNIPLLPLYTDGKLRFGSPFSFKGIKGLNPYHKTLSKRFVRKAHKKGWKVFTYTVNEEKAIQRCRELGVDGIITNFPERVKR
ncbi:MAG: glycerophosphodiester phosphodiesterase family protein [Bacteroidota bacterium]